MKFNQISKKSRIYIKKKKIEERISGNKIKLHIHYFLINLTGKILLKRIIATMYFIEPRCVCSMSDAL